MREFIEVLMVTQVLMITQALMVIKLALRVLQVPALALALAPVTAKVQVKVKVLAKALVLVLVQVPHQHKAPNSHSLPLDRTPHKPLPQSSNYTFHHTPRTPSHSNTSYNSPTHKYNTSYPLHPHRTPPDTPHNTTDTDTTSKDTSHHYTPQY